MILCALAGLATMSAVSAANASTITYGFSSGTRAATAQFTVSGNQLTITLTNTSMYDVLVPTDVLTAVYFDWTAPPAFPGGFTTGGAVLAPGSTVQGAAQPAGGSVGGEWAYSSVDGAITPGISSSGLAAYGPGQIFGGPNLAGPASPGGLEYGITSFGDNAATGNGGVNGTPLIKNSVMFTLISNELNDSFINRLLNVRVQYGTSPSEPSFTLEPPQLTVVPLPPAAWAGFSTMAGVIGIGYVRRRRQLA